MTRNFKWPEMIFTVIMLVLVLVVTLFPYDFHRQAAVSGDDPRRFGWHGNLGNFLANILLFVPLGFGLAIVTGKRELSLRARGLLVLGASLCLSVAVEGIQLSLPSRSPSYSDVLANIAGSWLGLILYETRGERILQTASAISERKWRLDKRTLAVAVLIYVAVVVGMVMNSRHLSSLMNWDDSYTLILGNEHTANRQWHGWIQSLSIVGRALSQPEVAQLFAAEESAVAELEPLLDAYHFRSNENLASRTGLLPVLLWRGRPSPLTHSDGESENASGGGVQFSTEQWLESALPATSLTRELKQRNQFTLSTVIATFDTTQVGPARIVSLSLDPYQRNFTLGQSNSDLVVRLRTPFTGENGMRPQLVVPGVLGTNKPRHLVVTYDGAIERVYVNGIAQRYTLDLRYAAALCGTHFRFDERDLFGYKVVCYAIVLVPLTGLGLLLIRRLRKSISSGRNRR